jgi:hypothetical protein
MDGKRFASSATTTERQENGRFCTTATRRPETRAEPPVQNADGRPPAVAGPAYRHAHDEVRIRPGIEPETRCSGWSNTSMAARYQHVKDPIRHVVAGQVGELLWAVPEAGRDAN